MRSVKETIKYGIECVMNAGVLHTMKLDAKNSTPKTVLMLSPQYLNYGDHAIAVAEIECLNKILSPDKPRDLNYSLFSYWPDKVEEYINPGDTIVVTGGGYMGNLWPDNHELTEHILRCFTDNRIIFAPQTLYYKESSCANEEKARFATALMNHGNFFFFGRDQQSCNQMAELGFVQGEHFDLMPDFVLLMPDLFDLSLKSGNPAVCLRSDDEAKSGLSEEIEKILRANIAGKIDSIKMAQDHAEIPTAFRKQFVKRKMQQFSDASVVVTDRLHGMIYAAYTGTPCVAFDNISRKVSGVYEWIKDLNYVAIADDVSQLPDLLEQVTVGTKEDNRKLFFNLQDKLAGMYLTRFASKLKK